MEVTESHMTDGAKFRVINNSNSHNACVGDIVIFRKSVTRFASDEYSPYNKAEKFEIHRNGQLVAVSNWIRFYDLEALSSVSVPIASNKRLMISRRM